VPAVLAECRRCWSEDGYRRFRPITRGRGRQVAPGALGLDLDDGVPVAAPGRLEAVQTGAAVLGGAPLGAPGDRLAGVVEGPGGGAGRRGVEGVVALAGGLASNRSSGLTRGNQCLAVLRWRLISVGQLLGGAGVAVLALRDGGAELFG